VRFSCGSKHFRATTTWALSPLLICRETIAIAPRALVKLTLALAGVIPWENASFSIERLAPFGALAMPGQIAPNLIPCDELKSE
jgi:hypothetical protein